VIVPDHFREISEDLWAIPIKTVALALFAGLLALEARPRRYEEARAAGDLAAPQRAGTA
jgi:hypothetical protein